MRRAIPLEARHEKAQAAAALFSSHSLFQQSQHIACYLGQPEEFDCLPLIQLIWQMQKICYLPVLSNEERQLIFSRYQPNDALHPNRYRILEPTPYESIAVNELDLVIVPLVAFDLSGNRLGMGGGYYDYTFAFSRGGKPYLLGLAYAEQHALELPCDRWDVKLQGVLTEEKCLIF